jgi:hypothetical protein
MRAKQMMKVAAFISVLAGAGAVAVKAVAGNTYQANVVVNTATSTASGTAYAARTAANTNERIDCSVNSYSSGSSWASCIAVNSVGTFKQCTSSFAGIVAAAQSIGDYSYIYFTWDASGNCTSLFVNTGSRFLP